MGNAPHPRHTHGRALRKGAKLLDVLDEFGETIEKGYEQGKSFREQTVIPDDLARTNDPPMPEPAPVRASKKVGPSVLDNR